MALAQRLNELAFANSEGLLHDDEYRVLRQNLFEQYSTMPEIPVEEPVVPLKPSHYSASSGAPHRKLNLNPRTDPSGIRSLPASPPASPPSRSKTSVTSGVTNFLRRATGRKSSASPNDVTRSGPNTSPTSNDHSPKRGVIPQIIHKKASEFFVRTDQTRVIESSSSRSTRRAASSDGSYLRHPYSPTQSPQRAEFPRKVDLSSENSVFDDDNLYTTKNIRTAIIATETEAKGVLEAFDSLELSTLQRVRQQTARRLPSATSHTGILLEGKEWRDPSRHPSSSPRKRRIPPAIDTSDGVSVRSGSSIKTTLSQSKSISSLRNKQLPGSPLSARFPPSSPSIHRKSSISSISSQTPSTRLRLGINSTLSPSRSTGNLPLSMLTEKVSLRSADSISSSAIEEQNLPAEVLEVRKQSREVTARYEARLEYLRAKLKSAELHEKLLRK